MSDDGYDGLRDEGRAAVSHFVETNAPEAGSLERVAWATGAEDVDLLRNAVEAARGAGRSWAEIAKAINLPMRTVQSRFGGGLERQKRYLARKRTVDTADTPDEG